MAKNINIHITSGSLDQYKDKIHQKTLETIVKVRRAVPLKEKLEIIFYCNPERTISEIGIGGYSVDANIILVALNPKFKEFNATLDEQLERTLVHELHHCLRWQNPGYGMTLLEALVTEGLADHFDIEVNGKAPQIWDVALTQEQIEAFQKKAIKEYHDFNYNHEEWFFGSESMKIPKWAGYTLGFQLVGKYLKKHPNKKPSQLYNVKAEEFIK